MAQNLFILALTSLIAAAPVHAAEEAAKQSQGGSSIERTIDKTGKTLGKTADKVEKSVTKGLDRAGQAVETAGKKTGEWLQKKTGGAGATDK